MRVLAFILLYLSIGVAYLFETTVTNDVFHSMMVAVRIVLVMFVAYLVYQILSKLTNNWKKIAHIKLVMIVAGVIIVIMSGLIATNEEALKSTILGSALYIILIPPFKMLIPYVIIHLGMRKAKK